jgi:hypothetical protein
MSRSYKNFYKKCQYFFCTDQSSSHKPKMKTLFARSFRRVAKNPFSFIGNNAYYKKWNCSYDIKDYVFVLNLRDIKKNNGRRFFVYNQNDKISIRQLYKMVVK